MEMEKLLHELCKHMQVETLHNAGLDFRQIANDRHSLKHDGKWAMPSSDLIFLSAVSGKILDKSNLTPPSPLANQFFILKIGIPPAPHQPYTPPEMPTHMIYLCLIL